MDPRGDEVKDPGSILNDLNRLQISKIANYIDAHPAIVELANSWVQGKEDIQLVSSYDRQRAYKNAARAAFETEIEKNRDLREDYLSFINQQIDKSSANLPYAMDTASSIEIFLKQHPEITADLSRRYEIQTPPNMVTYEEYACWALVTDDVMKVDPELLKDARSYLSATLGKGLLHGMQKIIDFRIDPKKFMQDMVEETKTQALDLKDDVDYRYMNLSGVKLTALCEGGDMRYLYMNGFKLTNADMTLADLEHAFLNNACLTGVRLDGANLKDVQLNDAVYDVNYLAEVIRSRESKPAPGKTSSLPQQGLFGRRGKEHLQEKPGRRASLPGGSGTPAETDEKKKSLGQRLSGFMRKKNP